MGTLSFISRIRDQLQHLSPSERRLAEFALDFPGDLAGYTASELASLANVSNATVTRFIRRLGYKNFEEARKQVRSERNTGSPLFLAETAQSSTDEGLQSQLQQSINNLHATFYRLSEAMFKEIAQKMLRARKVWLLGYRSNQALATYLRWQILQIIPDAQVFPGAGETLAEYYAAMKPDDVVIVFALRRRVKNLNTLCAQATQQGAKLLFITDQHNDDIPLATWSVRCDVQSPSVLDNHVTVISLCHLLASYVIQEAGTEGRRHLGSIETLHDAFREL